MSDKIEYSHNTIVSICVLCYNQASYIKKCIDSILGQKTNFQYEILIGDDSSTDGSVEICLEYQELFPEKIHVYVNEVNQGLIRNYVGLLSRAVGQYIAVCGGDDYWCDVQKLQKQVDFLQKNKDYSMCFTNAYSESNFRWEGYKKEIFSKIENKEYKGEDIILEWMIPASSVMFRNGLVDFSFLLQNEYHAEDLATYLKLAEYGKLYGMKDITTVYVRHEKSITGLQTRNNVFLHNYITTLQSIDKELNWRYHKIVMKDLSITYYGQAKEEFKRGSKYIFLQLIMKAFVHSPITCCKLLVKSILN